MYPSICDCVLINYNEVLYFTNIHIEVSIEISNVKKFCDKNEVNKILKIL